MRSRRSRGTLDLYLYQPGRFALDSLETQLPIDTCTTTSCTPGTSVGAALAVLKGVPSLLLRERARDNASSATYEARQRQYANRANRRHNLAVGTIGVGGAFILLGVPLMVVGAQRMNEADQRTIVTPVLSPTMAGLSTRIRF